AKAVQATLASQTHAEDEDAERRHARHDERERDRAMSRDRHHRLNPLAWWSDADKADLEYEVSRCPAQSSAGRRRKLSQVSVDPFGSRQPLVGPRADPFGAFDGLGRPRHDKVCTT